MTAQIRLPGRPEPLVIRGPGWAASYPPSTSRRVFAAAHVAAAPVTARRITASTGMHSAGKVAEQAKVGLAAARSAEMVLVGAVLAGAGVAEPTKAGLTKVVPAAMLSAEAVLVGVAGAVLVRPVFAGAGVAEAVTQRSTGRQRFASASICGLTGSVSRRPWTPRNAVWGCPGSRRGS